MTLTVNGTGFLATTTVEVGGVADATTYVNATQVTVAVTASQLASGAQFSVIALNGTESSGTGTAINLQVNNPVPTITSLSPTVAVAGAAPPTIVVTGTGFVPTTVIDMNTSARATTYVSATQVSVTLTTADVATAGSLSLTAVNAAPGGGTSTASTIAINNPKPGGQMTVSPALVLTGTAKPTTVTVTGTNFVPASTVELGGVAATTTFVSSTQLTFQLPVAQEATTQQIVVSVMNPTPGGGTTAGAWLDILPQTPTPVITSVSPSQFIAGSGVTTITAYGSNLVPTPDFPVVLSSFALLWNGTALTAQQWGSTGYGGEFISAVVPESLLTTTGAATITVNNSTSTPAVSNALTVTIANPPPPTLTSISPLGGPINTAAAVTLYGTGFTASSTVALNGTNIAAIYVSSTELTVFVPPSSVVLPGNYGFTVTTPAPGGGTTAPQFYTAYVDLPNNSMVYNPVNGLFYLSVPSAAGAPYGNTVVSVDPLTGALGTPIPVGSEPDKLAITADGKYLWVALDGASAVRMVDLVAGTAGMQFSIYPEGEGQMAAAALAALPGATNSVIVSTPAGNTGQALAIYDSGVVRGTPVQATYDTYNPWALLADGTNSEIYSAGSGSLGLANYNTYTYSASGLTLKASSNTSLSYASQNNDEIQIANGLLYTDFGQVENAETGALMGTFYTSGTTAAQGSTAVDSTLGLAFVLEGYYESTQYQLQAFDLSNFSATSAATIPIYNPTFRASYQIQGPSGNRLTRWGADGLAFRTTGGFVSLRTSMVQDLSSVNADIGVSIAATGTNNTGSTTTYTATITNNGPSSATSVALTAIIPTTGVLSSVTPSAGTCSTTGVVVCNLGGLGNGASATVVFNVLQTSAGSIVMTVRVSASENDPVLSNNQATSTLNTTGSAYNLTPTLSAISPPVIVSGSSDTVITLTGTNFTNGSTVLLNGTALSTSFSSNTELTATVPQADLANLGWAAISVSNPTPGGGTSASLPLSVFSVLSLGANHILYDPYSRKIMASIGAGTTTVAGNSIVAITPDTASIGTPVPIGGTPENLALTSDGQILYTLLPGTSTASVARFNMLTQQADFTVSGFQVTGYNTGLRDIATLPGAENTVAVDQGEDPGISIFDFNPATQTATARGASTGMYTGTCLAFPSASTLFSLDLYTSPTALNIYSVTAGGLVTESSYYQDASILQNVNCYKLNGGLLFAQAGGVANANVIPLTQVGVFEGMPNISTYGAGVKDFDSDTSLELSFYLTDVSPNEYSAIFDSITTFSNETFAPVSVLSLPFETIEGNTGFTGVDVFRWGQDGLAVLSSGGNIYLVRGGAIVPELLSVNSAASLTASSTTSITHGAGNTLLALTGTNLLPGVAVTWNGSYRTTTIVDAAHITVAIPASDLASTGSGSLVATNPGAPASNPLTVTIN